MIFDFEERGRGMPEAFHLHGGSESAAPCCKSQINNRSSSIVNLLWRWREVMEDWDW